MDVEIAEEIAAGGHDSGRGLHHVRRSLKKRELLQRAAVVTGPSFQSQEQASCSGRRPQSSGKALQREPVVLYLLCDLGLITPKTPVKVRLIPRMLMTFRLQPSVKPWSKMAFSAISWEGIMVFVERA